ncbi:biliverdin-producing heme oxygenase [Azospirillum halopraeferens]|uniref:biliverdin-producing heme oxygenase n=1 Tax=Azospirillum halopraeferens TaxID=34010 RepID=UPI0003F6684A|nr:biliverdin-producing heme oxygenase [Azospirillum halopraeferens]
MGPARRALRDATAAAHERLHVHPLLLPLTGPGLTGDAYRRALAALYGFHAPVERALGTGAGGRPALLRADLGDLGVMADDLPEAGGLPDLSGAPARLAARYVLDGSAHGGRAMLPAVTAALGWNAARGARFLAPAGAADGWRVLLDRLEAELADPAPRAAACTAAAGLFAALERWLDGLADGR